MPARFQAFDPALADAMHQAFNAAWDSMTTSGYFSDGKMGSEAARETLALRIIEIGQTGERDVIRLREDALAHVAAVKAQKSD
jgi:hypothetical protein